ncbi:UvrD-helicase domain-containing protein [Paenibacillus campinasensis]|uniref:UvrD-helicase domain-containing protein n=1 Tax=Paenibacillus campinasensis TaxID=66347 RepID=UPI0018C22C38
MSSRTFFKTPLGAGSHTIPIAQTAKTETSKDLIPNTDKDAFFFRSLEKQGIYLNEQQIHAVRHFKGPLLTLAGAGSGKTSVLVCRTGYLIAVHNVDPKNILLVTFSKKATEEMRDRIAHLPGLNESIAATIQARTFHSFFLKIIRKYGVIQDILSETRYQHIVLKRILREMGLQDAYQPETLLSLLSSYKMQMVNVDSLPEATDEEKELKRIFAEYEKWKSANNKIDFDDVLLIAYNMLRQKPSLLAALQNRFLYVMVDEFQDTNMVQYELIKMIVEPHCNLMIVGDDDQTIYSFNGARNEFILNFDKVFPDAKTITLDINYRSASSIVGLGNEVIRHNTRRKKKTLKATRQSQTSPQYIRPKNTDEEAEIITKYILRQVKQGKRCFGDFTILYRTASNSRAVIEQFVIDDVPFVDFGSEESFYEHWLVKPLIDHLRLALNPRNFEAVEGILPTLYINREQGMEFILDQETVQKKKWPMIHLMSFPDIKDFQKEKLMERLKLIKSLRPMKPVDIIQSMRREFYDQYLETNKRNKLTHHKEIMRETLDELESSAKRFSSIEEFVSFIGEVAEKRKAMERRHDSENDDKVSLMTIHKSKGLEFPVVCLIGASEGNMPHSSILDAEKMSDVFTTHACRDKITFAIEEERRLAYVAVTRAKDDLIISSPAYYHGKITAVSRFILDAFPKQPITNMGTNQHISGENSSIPSERQQIKETVYAWICTSDSCTAWKRINSFEEAELTSKDCPLCKAPMKKGSKEVIVNN